MFIVLLFIMAKLKKKKYPTVEIYMNSKTSQSIKYKKIMLIYNIMS